MVSGYPAREAGRPEGSKEEDGRIPGMPDGDNRLRRRRLPLRRRGGRRAGLRRVVRRGRRSAAGQRGGAGAGQPDAREHELQHDHGEADRGGRRERGEQVGVCDQVVRLADARQDTKGLGGQEDHFARLGDAVRRRRDPADREEARGQEDQWVRERFVEPGQAQDHRER